MTENTNSRIMSIYNARKTILELLYSQEYKTGDYEGFSTSEIDAMYSNQQLDMLISHSTRPNSKVYIKFYLSVAKHGMRQIPPKILMEIVEDLFTIDNVLTKDDTLIIIIDDEPNESIINRIKYMYDHDGIFVVIHNIKRLQKNILHHQFVPPMRILSKVESEELKNIYKLKSMDQQLPEISRFDAQAVALCMRPSDVACITRGSQTAMEYKYYRVCI
jgi:DNA-directed RNA polymerase subunit H (RpoH/RPB5)